MAKNIELKAKYDNLEYAIIICENLGAQHIGTDFQIDTYFDVSNGRLKLRESTMSGNSLIFYNRNDIRGLKESNYSLISLQHNPANFRYLLEQALGVLVRVRKKRELFIYKDTRIHLDTVDNLGNFIEFEFVVNESNLKDSHEELRLLRESFNINDDDFIGGSYSDLVLGLASKIKQPTWFHGSPFKLEILREGSTITQIEKLAQAFSTKPEIVSVSDDGTIKHNGKLKGYVYRISDSVSFDDIVRHPKTTMEPGWEWLTKKDFNLELLYEYPISDFQGDVLTEDEIRSLGKDNP